MAKGLKYWFEFGTTETPKKVEIYEEGFVGSSTQLTGGSNPLVKSYNKDVGEKYLGGVVSMVVNIEAVSTNEFQAINLISENYGDLLIRYLIDGVAQYNAIIVPFEGSDADLSAGIYNVSLGAECGLNQLKNLTYNHSNTRKSIIQVVKECLERLNYFDEFDIKVLDNTKGLIDGDFVGVDYWDTYINDGNFEGLSCLEVINQIKQVYNEIVFSDGAWWIRNIDEISRGNSNILTYDWATLDKTTTTYNRPTVSVQRRAGGTFGRLFSQQNIKITKPKSALSNVFPQGDMDNDTGWTYSGSAGLFLVIEDGFLKNNGATFHTPSASGLDNSYIQSPSIPFYPFQEWFDIREKEKIKIIGKATKGDYIKNLRLQVLAQAAGQTYYLTTEGTWYTFVSGSPTPIIEKTYSEGTDFVIDVPQPPYVTSTILSSADKIQFGEFGYFGNGIIPDTNIQYDLYIRVFYPERLYEEPAMSTDPIYGQELNVDIDYIHVQKVDISGVVENGFSRNYGLAETRDRKIDFTVSIGVGYPSFPSGLDCLFDAATGEDQIVSYKKHSQITGYPIDEHIAYSYLDNLSNQLGFYQGSIEGGLEFTDLIVIDDVKYRIHNLSHDAKFDVSQVKLVELKTFESVIQIDDIVLSDDILRNIEEQITKTLGSSTPLRYVDKNFTEFVLPNGERALGLRDDFKIKTVFSDEVFLRAASDGVITDVAEDTSSDFTLIKPAENGTYATREWVEENGWLLDGNPLTAEGLLGSTSNQTVRLICNSENKISLIASGGVIVHHDTTFEGDILGEGNITIEKGNPRLRLRDVGGLVHTSGFDIHVNGDSFLIDDNTHSRNILKNYLSSTTHITEFDADEYYFKDGATTYASLIGGNLNLPSLTASQLVATDASKNIVSLSTATYPSLTELSYVKGVTSSIQTQLNSKFALPSLTSGSVLFSNGTTITQDNANFFWDDINNRLGLGTASPATLLDVRGQVSANVGSLTNPTYSFVGDLNTGIYSPSADAMALVTGGVNRLHIDNSGNVGIGTATPTLGRLQLNQLTNSSSGGFTAVNSGVTGSLRYWVDASNIGHIDAGSTGSNAIVINSGIGNVGFGVATPAAKVDINGGILNNQSTAGQTNYQANHYYANSKYVDFQWYSASLGSISDVSGVGLKFDLATYLNFATGNIGIGTVPSYKLDVTGTGHFTGAVTFDTVPSSLQDATSANHLVRYSQWIASTSVKYLPTAVNTVALTNVSSLSGAQNINGVTGVAGTTRILLTAQSDATKNSIWVMQSGGWTRATDSDTDTEIRGFIVSVSGGTYAGYKYINTNSSAITIDTTNITYSEFSNISEIDPVFVSWRDTSRTANTFWAAPNGSNGAATWRTLVAADVPTLNQNTTGSAATLTTTRNIAATGDIAWNVDFNGSAAVSATATLATVNANIGTFNNVTVNAKGLVTAASNVSYLTANQTITLSGDVSGSGTNTITATLANSGVTAGTYTKITVDAKGRVTSGTNPTTLSGYEITDAQATLNGTGYVKMSGSVVSYDGRDFVATTGNETIGGLKTFSSQVTMSSGAIIEGANISDINITRLEDGGGTHDDWTIANYRELDAAKQMLFLNETTGNYLLSLHRNGVAQIFSGVVGLDATYGNASNLLRVDSNIEYSGTLKPNNQTPSAGQFLKANTTTTNTWATLTTSDISNLSSYTGFNDTYQSKDATLTALAALDTNGGILTQIGTDTFAKRTISGTTNRISITNGSGVGGNPTINISTSYEGQTSITTLGTITEGTWNGGIIPILYGGTGSSTQNFVDLTTEQNNIAGIKTFTSHILVRGLRIGESDGFAGTGFGGDVYVDTNALGSLSRPIDLSTDKVYFSDASSLPYAVITESGLKLGGLEHYGSIPSEKLDVDGNITFTGVLMPEGEVGTNGQFLKTTATSNVWSTILTSDVYNLETILSGKQDSLSGTGIVGSVGGSISYIDGSNGQIMAKDSAGNYNFMDLKIKPIGLSNERIGVGNIDNYLGEQPQFLFKDKRYISIGRITDNAKQLNIGMIKASNDAFIGHLGGKLSISATNGLYFNEFESPNAGLRMLTIDASGRISASTITSGGGVISDIQSVLTAGDVATDKTIIFRSTSTAAISLRDGSNVINGTLTNGSQVALASNTKDLEINGDTALNLYSNGNINIGYSSTTQNIVLNSMPFSFHEDNLFQGANKWGNLSTSASPQNGDMIAFIYLTGRMIPIKVRTEELDLGSGVRNYFYLDEL